jgi:hypothetical protein
LRFLSFGCLKKFILHMAPLHIIYNLTDSDTDNPNWLAGHAGTGTTTEST